MLFQRYRYHTNILCKYLVVFGIVAIFVTIVYFNQAYVNYSQSFNTNIFAMKCQERLMEPKETEATNLSHLMFVLAGSSRTWKHRRTYIESWWRPNLTRGNLFLDVEPSEEFRPWSPAFPPFKVNEDIKKLRIYPKLGSPVIFRMYRSILETYRLTQDEGVRWYVMGDDDSLLFVDNLVDMLSKYDHTKKHYIGVYSETVKSNSHFSFEMAFGGAGYALSYPLVETLVTKLDECIERYYFIRVTDQLQSLCLADLGVTFMPVKGFHQMDLHGDISGLLSSHPTAPLLSMHHFGSIAPLFPDMDRHGSVLHLMKAANVDQSRILQQSICHVRANNWTFSISWGYSIHIYENIFPRSYLMLPIETFRPWVRGRPPFFMFNTRRVSRDPCQAPHWFFFYSIQQENERVVTSYTRRFPRNMTSCSISGNISADPLTSIRVISPKTSKEGRKVECCDVEYKVPDVANIRLRDCNSDEVIAK